VKKKKGLTRTEVFFTFRLPHVLTYGPDHLVISEEQSLKARGRSELETEL
jgi:hypothetical protein